MLLLHQKTIQTLGLIKNTQSIIIFDSFVMYNVIL